MCVQNPPKTKRVRLATTEMKPTSERSATRIYQVVHRAKEAIGRDGEAGSQGDKWANLLREGNPTNACYIGKRRALLHVVLKV